MKRALMVSTFLMALVSAADAQDTRGPRLERVTAGLRVRQVVRVASGDRRVQGRFVEVRDASLVLGESDRRTVLGLASVDTLWTGRSQAARGAVTGGVIGAVALGALGLLFVDALCEPANNCSDDYLPAAATAGGVGAAGGALIGAGIGALLRSWRREFP